MKSTNKKVSQQNEQTQGKETNPEDKFGKFYLKIKDILQGNNYKL
jgi:hypothetical protein